MKHSRLLLPALLAAITAAPAVGQEKVDYKKYPDYSSRLNVDKSLVAKSTNETRPDHVNNAETQFFPAIINQAGGSCGSASRIYYMFGYEINALRGTNAKLDDNRYPTHFTWLLTNSNSSKDAMAIANGVPNVTTYGGATYSKVFGNQDTGDPDFGWMQGYDKWYSAMWNRLDHTANFPVSVASEAGREAVKQWIWNHNGNPDYPNGGICGIGVASGGNWLDIPATDTNTAIGVAGKKYVGAWGTSVDHALTIVGYDDRIEFDLDGNGVYGETDKDEVGAWIVANSWGSSWCNDGFIYCPYKNATPTAGGTNYYTPEIYYIRRNYRPLRTIKLKMEYSKRSELRLSAGISTNLSATEPDQTTLFEHFKYAGDGDGDGVDAETPMLGKWNGVMNYDPMEFGYDLTDLSSSFNTRQPLKYFFIIESKSSATGEGKIDAASIIDYEFDREGIETPFDVTDEGVTIQNKGKKTIISVVVAGEPFNAPRNLTLTDGTLKWEAPTLSSYTLTGYSVYHNDTVVNVTAPGTLSYALTDLTGTYQVAANYAFGDSTIYSDRVTAPNNTFYGSVPEKNYVRQYTNSGFRIKNIYDEKRPQTTIEYWLKPTSLSSWNQQVGPGWSSNFLMHTDVNGAFYAGWSDGVRVATGNSVLKTAKWQHIAVVVDGTLMTAYINGEKVGDVTSSINGIGGFGDLDFGRASSSSGLNGRIDEVRIWNTARTQREIQSMMYTEVADPANTPGLLCEVKMDEAGNVTDATGHYTIERLSGTQTRAVDNNLLVDNRELKADFTLPEGTLYAGSTIAITNTSSGNATSSTWVIDGKTDAAMKLDAPSLIFDAAGQHTVSLTVTDAKGATATKDSTFTLEALPVPTTDFSSPGEVSVGNRISFTNKTTPTDGTRFEWLMPGAEVETATTINAAASYAAAGTYTVTLKATNAAGTTTASHEVIVTDKAPTAAFDVTPNVVVKGNPVTLTDESTDQPTSWNWLVSNAGHHFTYQGETPSVTLSDPGRYNVTLTAANNIGSDTKTTARALTVCNADAETGLSFRGGESEVVTFNNPIDLNATGAFTIDWWMNPKTINAEGQHIGGTADNFMITVGTDGTLNVTVKNIKYSTDAGFIETADWHHYAVTYKAGDVLVYKDGKLSTTLYTPWADAAPTMPATLTLGGSEGAMNATIDEFRIWNKALDASALATYANEPITDVATAMSDDNLVLYYDFNQSSGNVKDATTNGNTGTRTGFGPEGDAWTTSLGVFCLDNFKRTDLSAKYLSNYQKPFLHTNEAVSASTEAAAFVKLLTDDATSTWVMERTSTSSGTTTGLSVDTSNGDQLVLVTKLYDFADKVANHKLYQLVTLPAGHYVFGAEMEEDVDAESYIAVGNSDGLPNKAFLKSKAIAYTTLDNGEVEFDLTEETTVSLGLVMNTRGEMTQRFNRFYLESKISNTGDATGIDAAPATDATAVSVVGKHGGITVTTPSAMAVRVVSLAGVTVANRVISGTETISLPAGLYIVAGQKVVVR